MFLNYWLLWLTQKLSREDEKQATRYFGNPARESPTTCHAQTVRIIPPPCQGLPHYLNLKKRVKIA